MKGLTVVALVQWLQPYLPQIVAGGTAAIERLSQALTDMGIEHDRAELLRVMQEAKTLEQHYQDIADGKTT